ncbi:Hsp20 family protein [Bradyrhizobium pachyrhizi]|uniref:Hsp20 family protein n=1 Tax=Bradyrhizobium pachyrhizi TaxID=280333 RepID=A0A844SD14_9BRAD|nr:Hsp20/alpha crystallin family protein [Bradyrhizobium pachyrhizi]MVT64928.1 Hsp20 family protein [Bradyrhizobium pachyrhizi]
MFNVEINETDEELRIIAELHGLTGNDIDVSVEDGVLTIIGEKREENGVGAERSFRVLSSMLLPRSVDTLKIDSYFDDGVITVTFRKLR